MLNNPPYGAGDTQINGVKINSENWKPDTTKLLLFQDGEISDDFVNTICSYITQFDAIGVDVYIVTIRQVAINVTCDINTMYSYILPTRLNLINNGELKNCSMVVGKNGETVMLEMFENGTRNYEEILRVIKEHEGL